MCCLSGLLPRLYEQEGPSYPLSAPLTIADFYPQSNRLRLPARDDPQRIERIIRDRLTRGDHQPEQAIGSDAHRCAAVFPTGDGLRCRPDVRREIGARPAEEFTEEPNFRGRQPFAFCDHRLGDGPVQVLDAGDRHFVLPALGAIADAGLAASVRGYTDRGTTRRDVRPAGHCIARRKEGWITIRITIRFSVT